MTEVRLLKNGYQAFPAMFGAIDAAQDTVAVEMYIVADDTTGREFRQHLVGAALRGVRVMVLIDAWGSWQLADSFWQELRDAGGQVRWFHPIRKGLLPFRNHRKMLLLDDRTVFLGGMNIADEYYRGKSGEPAWRDNMLSISGYDVARLRRSFLRMWERAGQPLSRFLLRFRSRLVTGIPAGQVRFLESGPDNPLRPVRRLYARVVQDAVHRIDLAMGYFYPHGRMLRYIRRAVKRGVQVRLLFPLRNDVPVAQWAARGLYGRLLRAGVEVWEYEPAMMHAKLAIADDTVIAGSANLDIRSGMYNYELVAVVNDPALAAGARADFEDDLRQSIRIRLEDWRRRPLLQRLKERVSYCFLARADILISSRRLGKRKQHAAGIDRQHYGG